MSDSLLRILLIEDDEADQWAFKRLIMTEGLAYEYDMAGSLAEARALLAAGRYDVVLTDHALGDGTSFDLIDAITAGGGLAIMVTGLGDAAVAVKALKAGFADYMVKDFHRDYLRALPQMIEKALQHQRLENALKESESRYRSVVEDAGDIIYRTDRFGRFTFYNPTVRRVLGYGMLELLGTAYLDVVRPDFRHAVRHFYARQFARRLSNTYFEMPVLTKEGATCWLGQNVQLLSDGDGISGFQAVARDISERKTAEEIVAQSHVRLVRAEQIGKLGSWEWDLAGNTVTWTDGLYHLFGLAPQAFAATPTAFVERVYPPDRERVRQAIEAAFGERQVFEFENRIVRPDGEIRDLYTRGEIRLNDQGKPARMFGVALDITERKRAELSILRQNRELAALNLMGQALSRLSEPDELLELIYEVIGKVLDNRNLYIALYDEAGQTVSFPVYSIDAIRDAPASRPMANGLTEQIIRSKQPLYFPRDVESAARASGVEPKGRSAQCYLGVPMLAGDKVIGVIAVQDYERAEAYDLAHLALLSTIAAQASVALENARLFAESQLTARTDALTGVANRRYLFELGAQELSRARRFGHPLSALMLDIDHFKLVNDSYGHAVGDQVLQGLARFCRDNVRDIDIVGRYGGEEFVILLVEAEGEGALVSAERLCAQVACLPIETDAGMLHITLSVGVASARVESDGFASLLVRADGALYAAKESGRNRVAAA